MSSKCSFSVKDENTQYECSRPVCEKSEDRCIFHLDDETLEEIDQKEVFEEFKREVETESNLDFRGINIPYIDFSMVKIPSEYSTWFDFDHATIGTLDLSNCDITIPLSILSAEIDKMDLSGARVTSIIECTDSTIGTVDLQHLISDSAISFNDCDIEGDVKCGSSNHHIFNIMRSNVKGDCDFLGSELDVIRLTGSLLKGYVKLNGTSIKEVHCHGVDFKGGISCMRAEFTKAVHFQESTFHESADFRATNLGGDVDFRGVIFYCGPTFREADIHAGNFRCIRSNSEISFYQAEFSGQTRISSCEQQIFDHFDIDDSEDEIESLNFNGAYFHGDLIIRDSKVNNDVALSRSDFNRNLHILNVEVGGNMEMISSVVRSRFVINSTEVNGDIEMVHSQLVCIVEFTELTANSLNLSRTELGKVSRITDMSLMGEFDISNVNQESDLIIEDSSIEKINAIASYFSNLHLHDIDIDSIGRFDSTTFDNFHIDPVDNGHIQIYSFLESTIKKGRIEHPSENQPFYDMTSTTLGPIDIIAPEGVESLSPFQFVETDFEGFDFTDHRQELEENNWEFDYSKVDVERRLGESDINIREVTDEELTEEMMYRFPDVSKEQKSQETTYLKAKIGAKEVGDYKSASEFLIQEMRMNRSRHRNTLSSESLIEQVPGTIQRDVNWRWIRSFLSYTTNSILDHSCGYGEKIWKIGGWMLLFIFVPAAIYPFTDVVNGTTGRTLSEGTVIEVAISSLYFSISTFTTLGYGDFQPRGDIARIVASTEAFGGVFLVGLLLYALGKQASR
ncbi:potassium channel family protein [Halopelagius longus]|uniref:Pentapeptide repeat-containing protein n=1 Tax=Halopelagius longus TaxID=1236180 RepID=A0A1H1DI30_9EURY|nr:potassium channel family protein [Halopelagius longus]RDI71333.1 hypothetical protein DWB78_06080 [Halopelagius longus]SDQ75848.1 Pentapeptide repeat-containing protein [Halopelagius longus]